MALTNFYVQSTGSDTNAGSSTANSADVAQTNGNWSTSTNIYAAAAGTPFSGVSAGAWASIYVDGGTVAVYIAQVTTVNSGGASVTLSSTNKYGTAPTTSATSRSCKINGAWATLTPISSGGLGTTTVPVSTKVNVLNGTYSPAAGYTCNISGTATLPFWVSGYNTTPGDLDNDTKNLLPKPVIAMASSQQFTTGGNYNIWSSFTITGNIAAALWSHSGQFSRFIRMRVTNSNTGTNCIALTASAPTQSGFYYCYFSCPITATANPSVSLGNQCIALGCVSVGGGKAAFSTTGTPTLFINCVALNPTGNGFLFTTGTNPQMLNCTVVGSSSDAVAITGTPATGSNFIIGCLFSTITGWGINNSSGTVINNLLRSCNDTYSCSSGAETGFGDSPNFFQQADSVNPITSTFNILTTSKAFSNGFPGIFENEVVNSLLPIGAVQPASSGATFIGGIYGS